MELVFLVPDRKPILLKCLTVSSCSLQQITHISTVSRLQLQCLHGVVSSHTFQVKGLELLDWGMSEISISHFLSIMPVMDTVTTCEIFLSIKALIDYSLDIGLDCLTHLPRVLPNLEQLDFTMEVDLPLTYDAILALKSLSKLRRLVITCSGVSTDHFETWRVMLPSVVDWKVKCR